MNHLSDDQISKALLPYGIPVDQDLCEKIRTYVSLLLQWNKTISLTTVTDPVEILKFHFGESLFAVSAVPIREGRLADVGSGAGFPGLPLRIAVPALDLTLIESNTKKCTFLSEVARKLNLDRVNVFRGRMEEFPAGSVPFDFITSRALGQHEDLLAWARLHLSQTGKLVLWLGEDDANAISREPRWLWHTRALTPGSKRRYLLAGSPTE